MTQLKAWVKDNSTLVYFLVAQAIAIGAVGVSVIAYMVRLETRVSTMETRGAAYTVERLAKIDDRITVLEQLIKANQASIDRIDDRITRVVDVMTREIGKSPK